MKTYRAAGNDDGALDRMPWLKAFEESKSRRSSIYI